MFGFMWFCPWRIEWKRPFEYWYRSQLGPFYYLHPRPYDPSDYDYGDDDEELTLSAPKPST